MQTTGTFPTWAKVELGAAVVSVVGAASTILWCGRLGLECAGAIHPWCGTGTGHFSRVLELQVPLALLVPITGSLLTGRVPRAQVIARCAALSALLAWGTVLACIRLS